MLCWLHVQHRAHADSARVSNSRAEINAKKMKIIFFKNERGKGCTAVFGAWLKFANLDTE